MNLKIITFFLINSIVTLNAMQQLHLQETLKKMTLPQKAAQLLVAATVANKDYNKPFMDSQPYHMNHTYIEKVIDEHEIGALIFLGKSTIVDQVNATQHFQHLSKKNPLLILLDAEWGPDMRLHNAFRFPRNMTLGALSDDKLIATKGFMVGAQLRDIGVHMSLGPVVDVNNNKDNVVINDRSFGSDPEKVAQKSIADMKGLQQAGVGACLKHFPGHGDTKVDSHFGLPVILHDRARLDSIELLPFRIGIQAGAQAIMTAHIKLPQLDPDNPATLSKKIINDLLRNELGFNGLVLTDGMGMEGITNHYETSEAAVKALEAGVDMILCANVIKDAKDCSHEDPIGKTIKAIVEAVKNGRLSEEDINQKVLRVLQAKEHAFNQRRTNIEVTDQECRALNQEIFKQAITLAKSTLKQPCNANIIMHIKGMNKFKSQQFGISQETLMHIRKNHEEGKTQTIVLYGSPYAIDLIKEYADCIIVAYEDHPAAHEAVNLLLENKLEARGILPV